MSKPSIKKSKKSYETSKRSSLKGSVLNSDLGHLSAEKKNRQKPLRMNSEKTFWPTKKQFTPRDADLLKEVDEVGYHTAGSIDAQKVNE